MNETLIHINRASVQSHADNGFLKLTTLLFTQYAVKVRGYPLSERIVSLHYLRSTLACDKTPTTVT